MDLNLGCLQSGIQYNTIQIANMYRTLTSGETFSAFVFLKVSPRMSFPGLMLQLTFLIGEMEEVFRAPIASPGSHTC